MVDFFQTIAGHEFESHIKTIALATSKSNTQSAKVEKLASKIYANLVTTNKCDTDEEIKELKEKAVKLATAFYEK